MFTRNIPEIKTIDLFKLPPLKALTQDQTVALEGMIEELFADPGVDGVEYVFHLGELGAGKTVTCDLRVTLMVHIE